MKRPLMIMNYYMQHLSILPDLHSAEQKQK